MPESLLEIRFSLHEQLRNVLSNGWLPNAPSWPLYAKIRLPTNNVMALAEAWTPHNFSFPVYISWKTLNTTINSSHCQILFLYIFWKQVSLLPVDPKSSSWYHKLSSHTQWKKKQEMIPAPSLLCFQQRYIDKWNSSDQYVRRAV